jgi:hypothetical protein
MDFEVIQTTEPNEGPRSPGAPTANAGLDQLLPIFQTGQLQDVVSFTGMPPVVQWKLHSGPGTVTIGDAAQTITTASFSTPGTYTLMLSADDSVHAVAYDPRYATECHLPRTPGAIDRSTPSPDRLIPAYAPADPRYCEPQPLLSES